MTVLPVIRHHAAEQRFEAVVEGARCGLEYSLSDKVMTINHTGVPSALGGRGIAAALAQAAFDAARDSGWRVVPACSYVAVWARRHPEVSDLLA